jgi:hypothetical protein
MRFTLLLLLFSLHLSATQRIFGNCAQTMNIGISNPVFVAFPSCTVSVFIAGTETLANIAADNLNTPKSNPFTAASDSSWFFYAPLNSRVDVMLSGVGLTPVTLGDISTTDFSSTLSNINGIVTVDGVKFPTIASAVAFVGTSTPTHIIIPSTYLGKECPVAQANLTFDDYRAGGRIGNGTSEFICAGNITQFNTVTPGFTDAMVRMEQTRSTISSTGSILSFYPITHLVNGICSRSPCNTLDGAATQANVEGTLTGTLLVANGNESNVTIDSHGGAITKSFGGSGYVFFTPTSTTSIVDVYGTYGRGCSGTPGHAINCYGGYSERQLSFGTGRNYAHGFAGVALFRFDSNLAKGGFDCEDNGGLVHPCLFVDGTGFPSNRGALNIQAVSGDGLNLAGSNGVTVVHIDANHLTSTAVVDAPNYRISGVDGLSAPISVKDQNGVNCQIIVTHGIITSTTCLPQSGVD